MTRLGKDEWSCTVWTEFVQQTVLSIVQSASCFVICSFLAVFSSAIHLLNCLLLQFLLECNIAFICLFTAERNVS